MNADSVSVRKPTDISRRAFLKTSGATALVIGFALRSATRGAYAADKASAFAPNAYLRITPDNRVTVVCGSAEM